LYAFNVISVIPRIKAFLSPVYTTIESKKEEKREEGINERGVKRAGKSKREGWEEKRAREEMRNHIKWTELQNLFY
jgi:hypothetical protein